MNLPFCDREAFKNIVCAPYDSLNRQVRCRSQSQVFSLGPILKGVGKSAYEILVKGLNLKG
jgi:hypothetical protein